MTDHYAVVGNPIAHSKSPMIHALFAKQTAQDIQYDKILIELGDFEKDASAFFKNGGKGLNITVPFKEDAFKFAETLTQRATLAGAVNTLALQADGSILGDTTDGTGLVSDLKNKGFILSNARILILGAGGAVRGVLEPLLAENPTSITIANRTVAKAQTLAKIFSPYGKVIGCGFDELKTSAFDIVINGTSASLAGELPPVPPTIFAAGKHTGAYDMMYGKTLTPFLQWAEQNNVPLLADGLGMLVGQAAASFNVWRGVMPAIEPVIAQLQTL